MLRALISYRKKFQPRKEVHLMDAKKVLSIPGNGHIDIWFDENLYLVNTDALKELAYEQYTLGLISGVDISDVETGHIVIKFNPVRQCLGDAQKAARVFIETIAKAITE